MTLVQKFLKNESGATAIEYGLIAALLSIAIIVALGFVRDGLNATYNKVGTELKGAVATN